MICTRGAQPHARANDDGFTLVELLVVIVIVGVLAAIAIPVFLGQREKGMDASVISDLNSAAKRAESISTDKPLSTIAFTSTDFDDDGFIASPGNIIEIAGSPSAGYCARGTSPGSSADNTATDAFWFDSRAGGIKRPAGVAPTGGACESASGWVTVG